MAFGIYPEAFLIIAQKIMAVRYTHKHSEICFKCKYCGLIRHSVTGNDREKMETKSPRLRLRDNSDYDMDSSDSDIDDRIGGSVILGPQHTRFDSDCSSEDGSDHKMPRHIRFESDCSSDDTDNSHRSNDSQPIPADHEDVEDFNSDKQCTSAHGSDHYSTSSDDSCDHHVDEFNSDDRPTSTDDSSDDVCEMPPTTSDSDGELSTSPDTEDVRQAASAASADDVPRTARKCEYCQRRVKDVMKHLRAVHQLSRSEAKNYVQSRKQLPASRKPDTRPLKSCPVSDCSARIQRLDQHMIRTHRLKPNTKRYRKYVSIFNSTRDRGEIAKPRAPLPDNVPADNDEMKSSLEAFKDYLTNPFETNKTERGARDICVQVRKTLDTLPGDDLKAKFTNFKSLMTVGLYRHFYDQKKMPGTIISYMCAMRIYVKYLRTEGRLSPETCTTSVTLLENWMGALKNRSAERRQEIKRRNFKIISNITDETLHSKYLKSTKYSEAQALLENRRPWTLNFEDRLRCRNHLMAMIGFTNAQRSGCIINMQLDEYNTRSSSDGAAVVLVQQHKTFRTHGHARIVISEALEDAINTYIKFLRPKYTGTGEEPLFLTADGDGLSHSALSKAIKTATGNPKATLTLNRMEVVTTLRANPETSEGDMRKLAQHMTHHPSTQQRFYDLSDKVTESVNVTRQLASAASTSNETQHSVATTAAEDRPPTRIQNSPRRAGYTTDQLEAIRNAFRTHIRVGKIRTSDVREYRLQKKHFRKLMSSFTDKQIVDKVRSLIRT